jgi:hypothetical protein
MRGFGCKKTVSASFQQRQFFELVLFTKFKNKSKQ